MTRTALAVSNVRKGFKSGRGRVEVLFFDGPQAVGRGRSRPHRFDDAAGRGREEVADQLQYGHIGTRVTR